uniref:Putative secreted protein n=1 Tax=Panstrongylus lignarius TaxID=156445 RepID=A0A224XRH8_9HEMI
MRFLVVLALLNSLLASALSLSRCLFHQTVLPFCDLDFFRTVFLEGLAIASCTLTLLTTQEIVGYLHNVFNIPFVINLSRQNTQIPHRSIAML